VSGAEPGSRRDLGQNARALVELRELLVRGEFQPGQRISELPLAAKLGLSRTPLRLALDRLAHEGLLESLAGGGFQVRRFALADVHDAIELRGVLEGTAARLAAERLGRPADLDAIKDCLRRLDDCLRRMGRSAEQFEDYVELNQEFHVLLVLLSQSPLLREALDRVTALPFASASALVLARELQDARQMLTTAQEQHRIIVEAIEAREGTRAEAMAREHARLARHNLDLSARAGGLGRVPGAALIGIPAQGESLAGER
jgi:GntR family transcriptional regulator of vanillate catabolism